MILDFDTIQKFYDQYKLKLDFIRSKLHRPLTLSEKILWVHLFDRTALSPSFKRGESYLEFAPDRVAMQDATAQMALLQLMQAGKTKSAVPATIHCDHLILAKNGADADLQAAQTINQEIYDFLSSVAAHYQLGFWGPGSGVIHQIVFENYAFPGGMMVGTDSHTPTAGGLGMIAIGVGGADAVDVMVHLPWELKLPKLIGVELVGQLSGWASPKDVILKLAGMLTVKGGTDCILEYFGAGTQTISATGKATICNMGAEIGATTSLFPYDTKMYEFLYATERADVARLADSVKSDLVADPDVYANPKRFYDQVITLDLSSLEPFINGPFTPDKAWPVSQLATAVRENQYPATVSAGLIGSCTNSSYEDLVRCASLIQQALDKQIPIKTPLFVSPGSQRIYDTLEKEHLLTLFQKMNAKIFSNACGPCIGQWQREGSDLSKPNSILTSFNRNFAKRNDGNPNTHAFVASPEMVTALSIAGEMTFNPLTDSLQTLSGENVTLEPPKGDELPKSGFSNTRKGFVLPDDISKVPDIVINPHSDRLQKLVPFPAWEKTDLKNLCLLIKVKGKCTTDHISMAGPWLKYRGHLDHISDNLLISAVNAFNGQTNQVKNQCTGAYDAVPKNARYYKAHGFGSVIIGEENYGEGSSREHAAMEPRYLGVRAVIVKSFARIHETNLKKQGVLACTFKHKEEYDKILQDDRLDILGLTTFSPQTELTLVLHHTDGTAEKIPLLHSYNQTQIEWFKAGSALNFR